MDTGEIRKSCINMGYQEDILDPVVGEEDDLVSEDEELEEEPAEETQSADDGTDEGTE